MKTRLALAIAWMGCAIGCTVTSTDGNTEGDGGSAGSAGESTGGSANGGAGGGVAGSAGQAGSTGGTAGSTQSACGSVPVEGICTDDTHLSRCMISSEEDAPPEVVTAACKAGMVCRSSASGAACQPAGQCVEGTTECQNTHELRSCVNGSWVVESCETGTCSSSGAGAMCLSQAGGQSYPITGRLQYEYLRMRADKMGYDEANPVTDDARGLVVAAYDGDEYIGGTYTSDSDGTFQIDATKPPTQNTWLYFFPMFFGANGSPFFAVAHPKTRDYKDVQSDNYWSFGFPTNGASDAGTMLVRIADGSGAIHLFAWSLYGLIQAQQQLPEGNPFSILALWDPGVRFDYANGTFYVPKGWGATVSYEGGQDYYESSMPIAGTDETPHQWSISVILHELGHYMMDAYSLSPREAAIHTISMREKPGMAWSEGWATFHGQMTMQSQIYFDKQEGTSWFFDISAVPSSVPFPDPSQPMDQELGELAVATLLWHLWDPGPMTDYSEESWDSSAVDTSVIWKAFGSSRMKTMNRGYERVDWVDYLDSLRCEGVTAEAIDSCTSHFGFPYDQQMQCSQ